MITLAAPATHEEEIKRSRFVAQATSVDSPEEALAFLEQIADPDATHNCWAYRIGPVYRFSDDGEPGGTAGRPMLGAIERQGVDHVMVVITRYYGGIKLGAGGLARAYGGTTATCLRLAERKEVLPTVRLAVSASFSATGTLYDQLERAGAKDREESYSSAGLRIEFTLGEHEVEAFEHELREASRGELSVERVEEA